MADWAVAYLDRYIRTAYGHNQLLGEFEINGMIVNGKCRPAGEFDALPTTLIRPIKGFGSIDLGELWRYRELLYFLVWREVKIRYKQTAIGAAWAVFQPLLTMVIFTAVFSYFARVPSDAIPYPLFALAGVLPWTMFSQAVVRGGVGLVGDATLIRKVYFPRLIISVACTLAPLADFAISTLLLIGFMFWYGVTPSLNGFYLPLFVIQALLTAFAVNLWLSPLHVKYRDVGHVIPFMVQIWMYASPIAYPLSLVPVRWRFLYSLNPVVGVVEGFRWGLLGKGSPDLSAILISTGMVVMLFIGGVLFFKRMERSFADVI